MFIVECLPLNKTLNKDSLSYFSAQNIEIGSLVKINVRGKNQNALVLRTDNVTENKSEIKSANFQLKKITTISSKPFLSFAFMKSAEITANYFASAFGATLAQVLPTFILENPKLISHYHKKLVGLTPKTHRSETFILQSDDEDRLDHYKSLIREEFAKNKSVFLCLPQNESILQAKQKLERGIESFVFTFSSEMNPRQLKKEWLAAVSANHPILIIGTAKWLFMIEQDFGTIIIEKENDSGWKTLNRPFIDLRFFAEKLAQQKSIDCLIGDYFLRNQTLYRHQEKEIKDFKNIKWRLPTATPIKIIDLKESTKKEKAFRAISKEILELITETKEKNLQTFIFASRKGLSATTVCQDCGEQVRCNNCASPMILYLNHAKEGSAGIFRCHQCGETRDANEVCQNCGSWKLSAFGAGIDRVAEEIRKAMPELTLFEINKDIVNTHAKALKVVDDFYNKKGSILLGTEMALAYLYKKVDYTVIASFDSLFAIPDFKIREKVFRLILQARDLAKKGFLIQTRNINEPTITLANEGNLQDFYKMEMADRKALEYPPYGLFIKITLRGPRPTVTKETEKLTKQLAKITEYKTNTFYSTQEKRGEQSATNTIIKLPRHIWPEQKLLTFLKNLPPYFEIKIDPESLL